MLHNLEIENFKSWAGRSSVEFGRLTALFGPNSSGKSSIIHLLLLLKQTVDFPDSDLLLNFGGKDRSYLDFGSFVDIITDHDITRHLKYSLNWSLDHNHSQNKDYDIRQIALSSELRAAMTRRREDVIIGTLDYQIDCSIDAEPLVYTPDGTYIERDDIEEYMGYFSGLLSARSERDSLGRYKMHLLFDSTNISEAHHSDDAPGPIGLHRFHPKAVSDISFDLSKDISGDEFPGDISAGKVAFADDYLLEWALERAELHAIDLLTSIVYLGPLRSHPTRNYTWTGIAPSTVGQRGEQAIQLLLAEESVTVDAVSKWMRKLGIAESLSLEPVGEGARIWEALIEQQDGATRVNLADVGFGVSQVLPVIVALLSAQPGSLVILEHPEIHLHPRIQSELADLLIEIANAGEIQILVESHSEHLLARIQRRIAEAHRNGSGLTPEDVRLYFCKLEQGKSKLRRLEMQPSGVITNWPPDFFGDMLAERMALSGYSLESEE